MRFTNLRLQNFKPFEDISVSFDTGVSVIHGPNGAGKSSFIEGAFFALYGVDGLTEEETLDEIVTNEQSECLAEVQFVVGNETYTLTRKITVGANGKASTDSCVIEWSDGVISGVRNTRDKVEQLLNMSAESYLNCAYVRQGEITRLINASPDERKSMIDDLLNLGILEVYKERGSNARIGVKRARRDVDGEITTLENSIEERDVDALQSRVEDISDEISRHNTRVAVLENQVSMLEDVHDDVVEQINSDAVERESELQQTKEEVERKIESKRDDISSIESEIQSLTEKRNEYIQTYNDFDLSDQFGTVSSDMDNVDSVMERLESRLDDTESELLTVTSELEELEEQRESLSDDVNELKNQMGNVETNLESEQSRLSNNGENRDGVITKIDTIQEKIQNVRDKMPDGVDNTDSLKQFEEDISSLLDSLQEVNDGRIEPAERIGELSMLKSLFEDSNFDVDIQVVDDDITSLDELVETLNDVQNKLSHLETAREETNTLVKERVSALVSLAEYKKHETRLNELTEKRAEYVESLHDAARRRREIRAEIATHEDEIETLEDEIASVEDEIDGVVGEIREYENKIDSLESRRETIEDMFDVLENATQTQERIEQYNEQHTQLEDSVSDLTDRHDEVVSELEAIETPDRTHDELVSERDRIETQISEMESTVETFESHVQSLHSEHGEVVQSLREYEREANRLSELREKKRLLDSLYSEAEELESLYGSLRSDLRESHVEQLETLMNEIFSEIYQTKSYQRVDISNDYNINIVEKSGSKMKPHMLSGGEKVVFNMSLRCAIYKLIAESGGDSPHDSLPPLILDEPTAHLDDEHVSQLTEVVDLMRDMGVSQTLIISHQQEIVDDADVEYIVSSNPTTNRSSIERDTGTDIQL